MKKIILFLTIILLAYVSIGYTADYNLRVKYIQSIDVSNIKVCYSVYTINQDLFSLVDSCVITLNTKTDQEIKTLISNDAISVINAIPVSANSLNQTITSP